MPIAQVNGIEICFDEFGSPDDDAVLLIRGFGSQMIGWREAFCEQLAQEGFRVVRFDNRDVGLSSKLDDAPDYTLDDMARDATGVLDHLEIDKAHVVGMSMGGMIAQTIALNHRERVRSLVSIMSHMGNADHTPSSPDAIAALLRPQAASREEAIEADVETRRIVGSPDYYDEDEAREMATAAYDRCHCPAGRARQALAIQRSPSREERLRTLDVPTTVLHGAIDPLIPVENGRRTASTIPGAELVVIDEMGHDIPHQLWDRVIAAIVATAKRAGVAVT